MEQAARMAASEASAAMAEEALRQDVWMDRVLVSIDHASMRYSTRGNLGEGGQGRAGRQGGGGGGAHVCVHTSVRSDDHRVGR